MKRMFKVQLITFAVLMGVYCLGLWSINHEATKNQEKVLEQLAPEGSKYLEYCDGEISTIISDTDDETCIAENPSDFYKFALAFYLIVIFWVVVVADIIYFKYLKKSKK